MKERYRVMATDENGENITNILMRSFVVAEVLYNNQIKQKETTEVILDKVFFNENDEWLENMDENVLVWKK